jgi:hypothetical protein
MLLKPRLALAFLFRVHGQEEGMGATEDTTRLKVRHARQARHGIQTRPSLKGFLGRAGERLPVGISYDTH